MPDSKSFLTSKTIWGLIIMAVGFGLDKLGFNVDASMQATLVDDIIAHMPVIFEGVGFILGVFGRIKATKSIGV